MPRALTAQTASAKGHASAIVVGMDDHFEGRRCDDPWHGKQPKYEKLVYRGPGLFFAMTRLPSGEPTAVQLGPMTARFSPPES
jgi:hypothetical protein